jgi:hypothetical protein
MPAKRRLSKHRDDYPGIGEQPRPVSRERWERHRERLMARYSPGKRPEEWWEYEAPKPRDPDFDLPESIQLFEMGELTVAELAELMPYWREEYTKAQRRGFSYCLGYDLERRGAVWISGAAARKAHCRWAGIPPAIVKQWDRERLAAS